MSEVKDQIADFHVRLGRLEKLVEVEAKTRKDTLFEDMLEFSAAFAAFVLAYHGFGTPNHYYQYVFAVLILAAVYHSGSFPMPRNWYDYILVVVNFAAIAMILKLVIGGGDPKPFQWISYPTIEGGLTSFKITWQPTGMAGWSLPMTVVQTFFLVLTLFGTIIKFDLFTGLTAFILVLLSLPSLISFNWTYALPAMIAALFSFYLQSDGV